MALSRILKIIHITDLHLGVDTAVLRQWQKEKDRLANLIETLGRERFKGWKEGTGTHWPAAVTGFATFLEFQAPRWLPEWSGVPAWLLDTGDLTTYGDGPSLDLGTPTLDRFA